MSDSETEVTHEDVRVKRNDDGPVLEVNGTKVLLRTSMRLPPEGDEMWNQADMRAEIDSDDFAWWNLTRKDGEQYPWLSIQPEVIE